MVERLASYKKDWLTHDIIGAAIEVHKTRSIGANL